MVNSYKIEIQFICFFIGDIKNIVEKTNDYFYISYAILKKEGTERKHKLLIKNLKLI